jgi:hypothetical protein
MSLLLKKHCSARARIQACFHFLVDGELEITPRPTAGSEFEFFFNNQPQTQSPNYADVPPTVPSDHGGPLRANRGRTKFIGKRLRSWRRIEIALRWSRFSPTRLRSEPCGGIKDS